MTHEEASADYRAHSVTEVEKLRKRVGQLEAAIRKHRDYRGDDRCWRDNEELYAVLPEGYTPPSRDTLVELENCKKYITSCHDPRTEYVSPQRRIEELERRLKGAHDLLDQLSQCILMGETKT